MTAPCGRRGTGHTTWIDALPREMNESERFGSRLLVIITGMGLSEASSRPTKLAPASSLWQLMRSLYALESPLPPLAASLPVTKWLMRPVTCASANPVAVRL